MTHQKVEITKGTTTMWMKHHDVTKGDIVEGELSQTTVNYLFNTLT